MLTLLIVVATLAGLFLAALAAFYLAGRRGNGARHETSIEIDAPPDRVWTWLIDAGRVMQWVGGLKAIESLTPDQGLEVGARDRLLIEVGGQQHEIFSEVTRVEPGRVVEQRLWQGGALAWHEVVRFTIEALEAHRSRFVVTASYTYTTLPGVIMEPIIRIAARRKQKEDLARLKALAEAGPR